MAEPAAVRDLESYRDAVTLRLTAENVEIVARALEVELKEMAADALEEISAAFGGHARKVSLADAAWKVRRQAAIMNLLDELGELA